MRTPQECLERLISREASTARALANLLELCQGREGATAMYDTLERSNLALRQRIYELRLKLQ